MSGNFRLAVWSGPRNISTAMMRSWGNRADTIVIDEPFYAHYLHRTGLEHPGRDAVLASQPLDWREVATGLLADLPPGKRVFYQKHMAHHLLENMYGDWLDALSHVFLLRRPDRMLASLARILPEPALEDTGLPQQLALFEYVRERSDNPPLVVDADDLLRDPEAMLRAWCESLGIDFEPAMLHWPPGRRASDGVWARHWYRNVEQSTGFRPPAGNTPELDSSLKPLLDQCMACYRPLYQQRLLVS